MLSYLYPRLHSCFLVQVLGNNAAMNTGAGWGALAKILNSVPWDVPPELGCLAHMMVLGLMFLRQLSTVFHGSGTILCSHNQGSDLLLKLVDWVSSLTLNIYLL